MRLCNGWGGSWDCQVGDRETKFDELVVHATIKRIQKAVSGRTIIEYSLTVSGRQNHLEMKRNH